MARGSLCSVCRSISRKGTELPRRQQPRQVGAHRANGRRDRHVVVVEDHDQPRVHGAGVVHRLIGHARAHGTVADDADDVVLAAGEIARHRHAEPGGNGGRAVRRAERVVFAFDPAREPAEAAALAQAQHALAPPRQHLVRIGLVAHVPDQPVARRVEHVVQRCGQLHHAEAGAQMTAGDRDDLDQVAAQLVGQLLQLFDRITTDVCRILNAVQQFRDAVVHVHATHLRL
jgi:hypothetical protein